MTTKHDGARARENMWVTRQALSRAQNRAVPKFKHPPPAKGKLATKAKAAEPPAAEQPSENPADVSSDTQPAAHEPSSD